MEAIKIENNKHRRHTIHIITPYTPHAQAISNHHVNNPHNPINLIL